MAPEKTCESIKSLEAIFLEFANVKEVEYAQRVPDYASSDSWVSTSEGDIRIFLDTHRDKQLLGEGLMRDIARRVQSLRKELGYVPTDIVDAVHIAELTDENVELLKPYLKEMEELVRAKNVYLHGKRDEFEAEWREYRLDKNKIYVAIS